MRLRSGMMATLLAGVLATGGVAAGGVAAPSVAAAAGSPDCVVQPASSAVAQADEIMAGRLRLGTFAPVLLPRDPTWREDKGRDPQWRFQFHALRWIVPLFEAARATGRTAYRDRAAFLLRDWARTNPRGAAASAMAWDPHATGWRAGVYACGVAALGRQAWLLDALARHGAALADPRFYESVGNHAVNESIGLLDAGLVLRRRAWLDLAIARLARVITSSVDAQGVMSEGAIFYQRYWYTRAVVARGRIQAAGRPVPAAFARIDRMPVFLAFATLPDRTYEMIGDTTLTTAAAISGTVAEFAATAGARGPRPTTRFATFARGYAFGRSGWGASRPYADEIAYTIRYGPPPVTTHQHDDATALSLYAYGTRLLLDPGYASIGSPAWWRYFRGRSAHNVVTVEGLATRRSAASLRAAASATMRLYRIATAPYAGVAMERRVLWSTGGEYLLVEDRVSGPVARRVVQRWHLVERSSPVIEGPGVRTRRARGNVFVRQLAGGAIRIVTGATNPIQGWVSYRYGSKVAAPVIETSRTGRTVRFLTLIVPYATARPTVSISNLVLFSDGYRVRVRIGTRIEQVVVRAGSASVTVLAAPAPTPTPTPDARALTHAPEGEDLVGAAGMPRATLGAAPGDHAGASASRRPAAPCPTTSWIPASSPGMRLNTTRPCSSGSTIPTTWPPSGSSSTPTRPRSSPAST